MHGLSRILPAILCLSLLAACLPGCGSASSAAASSSPQSSSRTATPTPTPSPDPYDPNLLTGEKDTGTSTARPLAVMLDNLALARPQRGINDCDILIEIEVEGGITRLCALFSDTSGIGDIGPVRSARDQFFRLILPLKPFYLHIGRSTVTEQFLQQYGYDSLGLNLDADTASGSALIYRDPARVALNIGWEHTAYTSGDLIRDYFAAAALDTKSEITQPVFDFVDYRDPARVLGGSAAGSAAITFSDTYRTYFSFDPSAGTYLMSTYSSETGGILETVDENSGGRTAFENVFVLFAPMSYYTFSDGTPMILRRVDYTSGGGGWYLSGGRAEQITWSKGADTDSLVLRDSSGADLKVNCGRSYIAVVSTEEEQNCSVADSDVPSASSAG